MRSDRVSMTEKHWSGLGLVVGVGNGQLGQILIGDSVQGSGDTAGGVGMHIQRSERSGLGSGVVGDCSGESGLPLDMTGVCLGPLGCHGYDTHLLCVSGPVLDGYSVSTKKIRPQQK